MKYGIVSIKPFPFAIPVLPHGTMLDGKLITTIKIYPHQEKPQSYPFQIDWKYRLTHGQNHFLTYICETKFIIEDDGVPMETAHLDRFIGDIYLNVEIGWEDGTRNTQLHGSTLPVLMGANLDGVRKQVLDYLI